MTDKDLISLCNPVSVTGTQTPAIGSLRQDSREVRKNDVFIAVRGLRTDGHQFIDDAVRNGASVVICEEPYTPATADLTVIRVEHTRSLLGKLAQAFQDFPEKELTLIGITGTNGKTTVATLVWQALRKLDVPAALLGTVAKRFNDHQIESTLTTADPIEIASDMRTIADAGCTHLVMEVSSHALDQERTEGLDFQVAAFTNLTHDHLDYHGTMKQYTAAKKKLFDRLQENARAVVNFDDPHGKEMIGGSPARLLAFSFNNQTEIPCNLIASGVSGIVITVADTRISSPLIGEFNAYNLAEAFLILKALGFSPSDSAKALETCPGAPGRLERVTPADRAEALPMVVVDYAHTPDALKNVAESLQHVKKEGQKLILVFGCGGDRDREKRPLMARIAETHADIIVVTSDNPRTEDPEGIIREIAGGFSQDAEWSEIASREQAITETVLRAPGNSLILIAGKGHETYQEINGERTHFDDREVARKAIDRRENSEKPSEVS
ncbi:MAG: UDP-N-acetylmuramoyl-L-alanyl-D-glutamate--2,6-diaminopimelate ligase [Balneolaceae bacterium]